MTFFLPVSFCRLLLPASIIFGLSVQNVEAQTKQEHVPSGETVSLLQGDSLDHFSGYKNEQVGKGWKCEKGVLSFDGSGGGDIVTKESFGDFELTFDWRVAEGANSGVMYRVSMGDGAPYLSGPEYQILDDAKHRDGQNELTSAGSLYGLYKPAGKQLKPVGQWNKAKIVLQGKHVEHWLNGKKVVDVQLDSDDWKQRVAGSKFAKWEKFGKNKTGRICFQDHGDEVAFRNIQVTRLDGK